MRKFTSEEKELIVNTPINRDCFGNCERMSGWVKDDRTIFIIDQTEDYYFRFLDAMRWSTALTIHGVSLALIQMKNEMKSCENYETKKTKCKYCEGRGLVAIGESIKGLKECPYCGGTGLVNR